jgi:hypothetical protein
MCSSNTCDMYMCRLRHINDPVLSSIKMEGIRVFILRKSCISIPADVHRPRLVAPYKEEDNCHSSHRLPNCRPECGYRFVYCDS